MTTRPLEAACPLSRFDCDEATINTWARKEASPRHEKFKARVVTCHDGDGAEPIGLYSLMLVLEKEKAIRKTSDVSRWVRDGFFPALHFEYLGVAKSHQGHGVGRFLTTDAIIAFSYLAEKIGVPVMTLRPLNRELTPFYAARNFVPYGNENQMMMSAETAIRLRDG